MTNVNSYTWMIADSGERGRMRLKLTRVTFGSLGPRIADDELIKIFLPGIRGLAAKRTETTGLGFGLAVAKTISDALKLELQVAQEDHEAPGFARYYDTRFSIDFQCTGSDLDKPSQRSSVGTRLRRHTNRRPSTG